MPNRNNVETRSSPGRDAQGQFIAGSVEASRAGQKGGSMSGGNFANNPERAREAGRKGGMASHGNRNKGSEWDKNKSGDTDWSEAVKPAARANDWSTNHDRADSLGEMQAGSPVGRDDMREDAVDEIRRAPAKQEERRSH